MITVALLPELKEYHTSWNAELVASILMRVAREIIARDGGICVYCGAPATTADHVVPKSRGGPDDPSNLVASCTPCNESKNSHPTPRGRVLSAYRPDAARPAFSDRSPVRVEKGR